MATVPITRAVLKWAVAESGLTVPEVSERVQADVAAWIAGPSLPTMAEIRELARILGRPVAMFFLPRPPQIDPPSVQFRQAVGDRRDSLNPDERKALREASRQQRMMKWISRQLKIASAAIPSIDIASSPDSAASKLRQWVGIDLGTQLSWPSSSAGFRAWRERLEERGVFVFLFSLGETACRGFSIFDDVAPVIAVNTAWTIEARIFSLFHELGHLVTRTNSACGSGTSSFGAAIDPAERWCERFAACLLLPESALAQALLSDGQVADVKNNDLTVAINLARRFRISVTSAVIRLIEAGAAGRELFAAIPPTIERRTVSGGRGRSRVTLRVTNFGRRATSLYFSALRAGLIQRHDISDYLRVSDLEIDELQRFG